jgi:hypothetical protein
MVKIKKLGARGFEITRTPKKKKAKSNANEIYPKLIEHS